MIFAFVILLLILLNGFFAAAEMAFVAARPARLQILADDGDERAKLVLKQKEGSADFLAMVQIGITFVATLASAVGGATLADQLALYVEPIFGRFANQITLTLIVIMLTYLSLVIGELVPKQMALQFPEALIVRIIRPLNWFRRVVWIPIRFLDGSSAIILRLFRVNSEIAEGISAEEVRHIVDTAVTDGEISTTEQLLINQVFNFSTRSLTDIMTPRPSIAFVHNTFTVAQTAEKVQASGFSRLPIVEESDLDSVEGYLHVKDLLGRASDEIIGRFIREVMYLPESLQLPIAFKRMTQSDTHLALVIDEFGSVAGLVTIEDIIEEIVGEIEDEYGESRANPEQTEQNRWQIDGAMSLHDFEATVGIALPSDHRYTTVGGYLIAQLGRLPYASDQHQTEDLRFTIQKMERRRIAQITVERQP